MNAAVPRRILLAARWLAWNVEVQAAKAADGSLVYVGKVVWL